MRNFSDLYISAQFVRADIQVFVHLVSEHTVSEHTVSEHTVSEHT